MNTDRRKGSARTGSGGQERSAQKEKLSGIPKHSFEDSERKEFHEFREFNPEARAERVEERPSFEDSDAQEEHASTGDSFERTAGEREPERGERKHEPREIVVPGQVVAQGLDFLPGEGTMREGQNIISVKFGLLDHYGRLVKVIPITGTYLPKRDDIVIGEVTDITPVGWVISLGVRISGLLTLAEGSREYIEKNADLTRYYNVGDLLVARVHAVKPRSIDFSMKGPGLRKLDEGLVVKINPYKVPRVIGKAGSMVNLIKDATNCNIVVGQNGLIWVKGKGIESELLARDAIKKVEAFSHIPDLTERISDFLSKARGR